MVSNCIVAHLPRINEAAIAIHESLRCEIIMNRVIRGCRLRPYNVLAVSATLHVYPRDAVPCTVRSGHATEGMKVAVTIWIPKSAFELVSNLDCIRDNGIQSEIFGEKESPESWMYEH